MKLRGLGLFTGGAAGMAWLALECSDEALVIIGLVGFAIAIFCAGFRWGEWQERKETKSSEDRLAAMERALTP